MTVPPFVGKTKRPVSGLEHLFDGKDDWLRRLAARELIAVRRGVLKFRGWKPKKLPVAPSMLTDDDFVPDFEQKGVDMRIGLDIATFSATKAVHRIVLVTGDTDCVPAMKHGRIAGLQVVLAALPKHDPAPELKYHSDYLRQLAWPASSRKLQAK